MGTLAFGDAEGLLSGALALTTGRSSVRVTRALALVLYEMSLSPASSATRMTGRDGVHGAIGKERPPQA
jgi:hypothetical protein